MEGIFITFEGGEGSGKTTQINLLKEALQSRQFDVMTTREPGGTPIGQLIRNILLDAAKPPIAPLSELLLYSADRAQHLSELVQPALAGGRIVLCDRFTDATVAYQGYGRTLELGVITDLNHLATQGLQPALTFLLDCPVEIGLERSKARLHSEQSSEDRFEREQTEFHERVRRGYLELAQKNPKRFRVLDATQSTETLHSQVLDEILKLLGKM